MVYSNQCKNAVQGPLLITNYRSNDSGTNSTPPGCAASNMSGGKCLFCGGSNTGDANTGPHGYQCFQQPGHQQGTNASNGGSNTFSYPLYEFLNCTGAICTTLGCAGAGSQDTFAVYNNNGGTNDYTTAEIAQNRDYYDMVPSGYNGTSGVGVGLLAARPSTCTAGVGYWATDHSTLYQCGAGNTWSTYYTPYTYPHPLDTGSTYTITISSITGGGTVTSSDSVINCTTGTTGTCLDSTATGTITLTETPAAGYVFSSWGGEPARDLPVLALFLATATVTATFTAQTCANEIHSCVSGLKMSGISIH